MIKIYLLALFAFFYSNSQIKSGKIVYNVVVTEKKESELEKMMVSMNSNFYSITKEFEFLLNFNKNEALFTKIEKLYSDNDAANLAIIKLSFLGNILIKNDSVTKEGKSRTIGNYLVSRKLNKDWKLVNETKLIDKYTCYKATTVEVVQNPKGNFEKDIIAWYCPELPFSFGPLGYGGLPGLILELQTENGVFGAKELKLIETDIEIQNLKNYKKYSETELNKLIEEKIRLNQKQQLKIDFKLILV